MWNGGMNMIDNVRGFADLPVFAGVRTPHQSPIAHPPDNRGRARRTGSSESYNYLLGAIGRRSLHD